MASLSHIARPYARAAFDCAKEQQQLLEWKTFLASAACMTKDTSISKLLSSPESQTTRLCELYLDVLKSELNEERKNFLHLLAQNRRLAILPEIAETFDAYYAVLEKMSAVRIVTAVEAKDAFKQTLIQALTKRIQRAVTLKCDIDPDILGGAIIHMGDNVIDGSIRGKLTRLLEFSLR